MADLTNPQGPRKPQEEKMAEDSNQDASSGMDQVPKAANVDVVDAKKQEIIEFMQSNQKNRSSTSRMPLNMMSANQIKEATLDDLTIDMVVEEQIFSAHADGYIKDVQNLQKEMKKFDLQIEKDQNPEKSGHCSFDGMDCEKITEEEENMLKDVDQIKQLKHDDYDDEEGEFDVDKWVEHQKASTEAFIAKYASPHIVKDPRTLEMDFTGIDPLGFDPYTQKAMKGSVGESSSHSLLNNGIYSSDGRTFKLHSRIPDTATDRTSSADEMSADVVKSLRDLLANAMLPTPNKLPDEFMTNFDDQPQTGTSRWIERVLLRAANVGNLTLEDIEMDGEVNIEGVGQFETKGLEAILEEKVKLARENPGLSPDELWKKGMFAEEWSDPFSNMEAECEAITKAGIVSFDQYPSMEQSNAFENFIPPDLPHEEKEDIKIEEDGNSQESTSKASIGRVTERYKPRSLSELMKEIQNLGKEDNSHWKGADAVMRSDNVAQETKIDIYEDIEENDNMNPEEADEDNTDDMN